MLMSIKTLHLRKISYLRRTFFEWLPVPLPRAQYEDSETGLYYNRFRYYDSSTGNYISQDPIGLAGKQDKKISKMDNRII